MKKFSVKRISNPLMFDPLNNAVPEGLYDPALGPTENHQRCVGSRHAVPHARSHSLAVRTWHGTRRAVSVEHEVVQYSAQGGRLLPTAAPSVSNVSRGDHVASARKHCTGRGPPSRLVD